MLPQNISLLLYNTIILPHINYMILVWGHHHKTITQLQKRAIRVITLSKYLAHTEPLFKNVNILKVEDIFRLQQIKFYYRFINITLPDYFLSLFFSGNTHQYLNIELERSMSYRLFEYIMNLLKRAFYTVFLLL